MKPILVIILLFFSIVEASFAQSSITDCIIKINSKWGEENTTCGKDNQDAYSVVLQNNCDQKVDLLCAVLTKQGEWTIRRKDNLEAKDTLKWFCCEGEGKYQFFVRVAGTKKELPTYEELNKVFLEKKQNASENKKADIKAKLFYGNGSDIKPLKNQKVKLHQEGTNDVPETVTDKYGSFEFKNISTEANSELELVNPPLLKADEKYFIAKQNGMLIKALKNESTNNFKYTLLPTDIIQISNLPEEDPFLALAELKSKGLITVRDPIRYEVGKFDVSTEVAGELNRVIEVLKSDSKITVELASYTDALGEDKHNLQLSERRARAALDYLVAKGVDAKRIKATGFGESKILNRCKNGAECSEEEHAYNRRTEFTFKYQK